VGADSQSEGFKDTPANFAN